MHTAAVAQRRDARAPGCEYKVDHKVAAAAPAAGPAPVAAGAGFHVLQESPRTLAAVQRDALPVPGRPLKWRPNRPPVLTLQQVMQHNNNEPNAVRQVVLCTRTNMVTRAVRRIDVYAPREPGAMVARYDDAGCVEPNLFTLDRLRGGFPVVDPRQDPMGLFERCLTVAPSRAKDFPGAYEITHVNHTDLTPLGTLQPRVTGDGSQKAASTKALWWQLFPRWAACSALDVGIPTEPLAEVVFVQRGNATQVASFVATAYEDMPNAVVGPGAVPGGPSGAGSPLVSPDGRREGEPQQARRAHKMKMLQPRVDERGAFHITHRLQSVSSLHCCASSKNAAIEGVSRGFSDKWGGRALEVIKCKQYKHTYIVSFTSPLSYVQAVGIALTLFV
jgi:hypothetical protein